MDHASVNTPVTETRAGHDASEQASDKRKFGRVKTEYLECIHAGKVYGTVVDLSSHGARMYRKGPMQLKDNAFAHFTLRWQDIEVPIQVQVAWLRKTGWRRFLYGLKFINLNDSQKTALAQLAQAASNSVFLASQNFEPQRHGPQSPSVFRSL